MKQLITKDIHLSLNHIYTPESIINGNYSECSSDVFIEYNTSDLYSSFFSSLNASYPVLHLHNRYNFRILYSKHY